MKNYKLKETTLMTIVSLLDELVNALLKAEGTFLDNPKAVSYTHLTLPTICSV